MSRPAVFLDRDGTIIEERSYIDRLGLLSVFPWTGDALRLLNRAGYAAVVISNQSGIARGMFDEPFLTQLHNEIDRRIAPARIDGYFFCPHLPDATVAEYRADCDCRKPKPGLIALLKALATGFRQVWPPECGRDGAGGAVDGDELPSRAPS